MTKENNLELHIVIIEIDCHGKELQSAICVERKIVEGQKKFLLKTNAKIKQQIIEI
jgi:hypothetical protein